MKRATVGLVAGLSAVLVLSACGGSSNPLASNSGPASPSGTIVVGGSGGFVESQLLGEIYYEALTAKGIKASTNLNLGSREVYFPALQQGSIDLMPEYTGTLLQYMNAKATQVSTPEVYAALQKTLPSGLIALNQATAQDKDAVVVTKATAAQYNAKSIADLAPHCGDLTFGGTPEFLTRVDGIPGLQKHYSCTFKGYTQLQAGTVTALALQQGKVQAADIFTTDPSIAADGFVVLADPANNFAAQNVVPIINAKKATAQVKQILNAVQAKLDTATLAGLDSQLNAPSKPDLSTVAKQWLAKEGLS
ncbi:MAG TPA: ABC transporter substrate-binding protein [Pseudonocardiaceae bacterium]|nr:ABC transporter substrate-binding protein [Pseudonocardiaceae bacterium]